MLFKRTTSVAGAEHQKSFSVVLRSTLGSACRLKCAAEVVNCITYTFDYDKVRRRGTHLNLMASYAELINAILLLCELRPFRIPMYTKNIPELKTRRRFKY